MAESEGFEPSEPCGSAVFKTAGINHSPNFPCIWHRRKGSNPGPTDLESVALPTELHLHIGFPATLGVNPIVFHFTLGQLLTERS
jgi:hypothetical protein